MDPDQINQLLKASLENREQKWTWISIRQYDGMTVERDNSLKTMFKKRKALSVWDI